MLIDAEEMCMRIRVSMSGTQHNSLQILKQAKLRDPRKPVTSL